MCTDFTATVFRHTHWTLPLNVEPHAPAEHFTNVTSWCAPYFTSLCQLIGQVSF